ncbi:group 1 glycosyl transferase [Candidatus Magnetoovum chiemensis]|nr:group 1 glycosyl transferase [Candidatus Magnetoovum chiemensis]
MTYKADLHLHSKYSNKPTIWALRKINCPESFTTPEHIYKTAKANGMNFVTITDHNSIHGALEIAHYPDAFVSSEITSYVPEDNVKIHVLVYGINERQFKEIMSLRKNVYELTLYLRNNDIAHSLAHPLFDISGNLTVETLEKLLLTFEVIEVKNGADAARFNLTIEKALKSLNREKIEHIANKHNMAACGIMPWIKGMTGGSDDHSGYFLTRAYTVSKKGSTVDEFLNAIKACESFADGEDGDSLSLAHSFYGIGYQYVKERLGRKKNGTFNFIQRLSESIFNEKPKKMPLIDRLKFFIYKNYPVTKNTAENATFEQILDIEAKNILSNKNLLESLNSQNTNNRIFTVSSYLANRVLYIYAQRLFNTYSFLDFFELINSITSIVISHLLVSPYYISYHLQNRSRKVLREFEEDLITTQHGEEKEKIALFTDTLYEITGVDLTIKRLVDTANMKGNKIKIITCTFDNTGPKEEIMNFKSIGDFSLPDFPQLKLSFPPILDIIYYLEKENFTKVHVSTPGTMGLAGLIVAKLMDLPISGTYHTDIPLYVRDLTNDLFIEGAAWSYMVWFYNMMDDVTVPSAKTKLELVQRGLDECKIKPMPRWVDTNLFSPQNRKPKIWREYGFGEEIKYLYVGRITKEKNLNLLAYAFKTLIDEGYKARLIIVGEGLYREDLETILEGYPVTFTGFKTDRELYTFYASSDVFVYPGTGDTFGNVVLEAQASGLPVIVFNEGYTKELVKHYENGIVVELINAYSLFFAMAEFAKDRDLISQMGQNSRNSAIENSCKYQDIMNYIK